jgi:hypothetical protein
MNDDSPKIIATNVLDFLLESFACAQEMDLYDAVCTAPPAKLESVLHEYRNFASGGIVHAPPLSDGEIRPYFATDSLGAAPWADGTFRLEYSTFASPGGHQELIWQAVDAIKYRLLYCHSLAVDDLLGDMLFLSEVTPGRQTLLNYVNFLLHMGPLVRSHVLCFVTPRIYLRPEFKTRRGGWLKPRLEEMLSGRPVLETLDFQEIERKRPKEYQLNPWPGTGPDEMLRSVHFNNSCERISRTIAAAADAPGLLSVYLPFQYDIDLLSRYQEQALVDESIRVPLDDWLISKWIDIELPGFDKLSPEDLVNIRTQSEEFDNWRGDLKDAMQHANNSLPNVLVRNEDIRWEVKTKLREGKARLEASLPRSAVLKGLKKGTVSMLGGALSLAIVSLLDPTKTVGAVLEAFAGVAGSAGISALAEALEGNSSNAKRAAWNHYVAMLE